MVKRIFVVALCTISLSAFAQFSGTPSTPKQPSPEEVKKIMEMSMGAMVPVMTKMTDGMIEVMLQRAEDPSTAQRIAKFKRNLYNALLKEGFTAEQSLAIMESTSLPAATPSMK